jgi:hypothetical protein
MAYKSGFFNAKPLPNGGYDREYNATDFSEYFSSFISNGVFNTVNQSGLQVTAGRDLSVNVNIGNGFINGFFLKNYSMTNITLEPSSPTYNRIDNIVMQLSLSNSDIILTAVTGTPSATPTAPTLVQNGETIQLCLATVEVEATATTLSSNNITDTRSNTMLCGWASATAGESEQLQKINNTLKQINNNLQTGLPTLGFTNFSSNNDAVMGGGEIGSWIFETNGTEKLTMYACEVVLSSGEIQQLTFPLSFNRYCFPICAPAGVQSENGGWEVPSSSNMAPYGNNACIPTCTTSQLEIMNPWGLTGAFYLYVIGI